LIATRQRRMDCGRDIGFEDIVQGVEGSELVHRRVEIGTSTSSGIARIVNR
jgi:hypothetical protein